MLQVLLAEYRLLNRDAPVNAQRLILDVNSSISLRMIELIALVLENGHFGEYGKAMCKASGDKELTMIISCCTNFHHVKKLKPCGSELPLNYHYLCPFIHLGKVKGDDGTLLTFPS